MQAKDKLKILGKTLVGNNNGNDNRFKSDSKPPFKPYVKSNSRSVNLHEMSAADFVALREYFTNQTMVEEQKPTVNF